MKRKSIALILVFALVSVILQTIAYADDSVPCTEDPCCCSTPKTIGYWKNHAGAGKGNQADMVSELLPADLGIVTITNTTQAVECLKKYGDASNGINKLTAQLLAAGLNYRSGCEYCDAIDEALDTLSNLSSDDWDNLDKAAKSEILSLAEELDDYNNGL